MADFFGEGVTDNVKIEAVPENQAGEDFLAQTQNEISQLEGDFFNTNATAEITTDVQTLDLNQNDSDINEDNEIMMTETQELDPINSTPVVVAEQLAETSTPNEPSAFSNNYAEIKIEAAAIREWREQNDKRIQEADEKEHEAKQQMLADARRELEEWKQSRNDNLEKTKIRNRENEQDFINERETRSKEEVLDCDWKKVSELCDFSKKKTKGARDTDRMKSLILQMK